jgi:hypothetical protein
MNEPNSTCPNDDPKFSQMLTSLIGSKPTPAMRQQIFYLVCIVVRAILYSQVYKYRDHEWVPYIIGVFALVSVYNLYNNMEGAQWWSKRFQFVIACLLLIASVMTVYKQIDTTIIPYILFASLGGGILQSFMTQFC